MPGRRAYGIERKEPRLEGRMGWYLRETCGALDAGQEGGDCEVYSQYSRVFPDLNRTGKEEDLQRTASNA